MKTKPKAEIVAALRVKNESRWLADVLRSVSWCDAIYLFDDHSTDGTPAIARECGAVVMASPFDDFNEARDKEYLITMVAAKHKIGTWVLMIDGDEVLEPQGEGLIRSMIASNPIQLSFSLRILYLWNSRKKIRVDGVYGQFKRPSLFRLVGRYSFKKSGINGNIHCSCVPVANFVSHARCPAALLHLGYMEKVDRIRKWEWYNALDPVNMREGYDPAHPERGSYPHMIQGDIPQVPANIVLKHSGPLELRDL
jgi:glycosyltransferase involved in cell wall biosynthesis